MIVDIYELPTCKVTVVLGRASVAFVLDNDSVAFVEGARRSTADSPCGLVLLSIAGRIFGFIMPHHAALSLETTPGKVLGSPSMVAVTVIKIASPLVILLVPSSSL